MKRLLVGLILALGLGLSQGACGPAPAPADPSFKTDVLPIMQAHCIRCHGAGDKLNADPMAMPPFNLAPEAGYFDSYEDRMCGTPPVKCTGAKSNSVTIQGYIHFTDVLRMPPRPSLPLSDYEMEVIDNWAGIAPNLKTPPKP